MRGRARRVTLWAAVPVLFTTLAAAEECICRLDGSSVSVSNFPQMQTVKVGGVTEPLDVREAEIRKTLVEELDLGSGEKDTVGPFNLTGWRRIRFQVSQVFPKTSAATPLHARWYVRFHPDDAFFDPCQRDPEGPRCTVGFMGETKIVPLLPAQGGPTGSERLHEFTLLNAPVSIATFDLVGAEGLLVVDNAGAGPRSMRVHAVLER